MKITIDMGDDSPGSDGTPCFGGIGADGWTFSVEVPEVQGP